MAGEKRGGGTEELAAKLAAVESGVSRKETAARTAEEEARQEHQELIKEMADMIEGNQALNKGSEDRRNFTSAYRRIEYAELDQLRSSERLIEQNKQTITEMEVRVAALADKGEDVLELQAGLGELKQDLEAREAELVEARNELKELEFTNRGFIEAQRRTTEDQAGFAIETVLAQREYAADPSVKEARKLPEPEKKEFKNEVASELARREEERQQEQWRQEDQERILKNQRIIQEVKGEFLAIKARVEDQAQQVETELADKNLAARVKEQKGVIEAKLSARYFWDKSRIAAGAEAQKLVEALEAEQQDFYGRVTEFNNQARSVFGLIRDHGGGMPYFYCISNDERINRAMLKVEEELKALDGEMQGFAKQVLSSENKAGNKTNELYEKIREIFGGYEILEALKRRAFDLQRET